jgi:hypothetical protein
VLFVLVVFIIWFYTHWAEKHQIQLKDGQILEVTKRGGTLDQPISERLRLYADYAAFSDNAYKPTTTGLPAELSANWKPIAYFDGGKWNNGLDGLPDSINLSSPSGKKLIDGLAFKIWEQVSSGQIKVVIAFRGTNVKELADWETNIRWVRRWVDDKWDQYNQVQDLTPKLVDAIYQRHQGQQISIVATGHSLGGGLAQQAAYATDKIKEVFAFDPSPVTGYYDIPKEKIAVNKKNIKVERVYERGEWLSYARTLVRVGYQLSSEDPNIAEIGFNFVKLKNPITKQHGIASLALELRKASLR